MSIKWNDFYDGTILQQQQTSKSTDMQTALQLSMRAIQHENVDVRIHALTSLKEMIYKNQVGLTLKKLESIASLDAKTSKCHTSYYL